MRAVLKVIDFISEWTGKTARWLCLVLVLAMTYEIIMRYVFRSPLMWAYETSIMLGGAIYALSWAYTHKRHDHIRIDVFYSRLSLRGKAIVDVTCTILLFFPLLAFLIGTSSVWMWRAWKINEKMAETYWYPPAAPIRTVVVVGFCLFALQAVAQFIRDLYVLFRNKAYD